MNILNLFGQIRDLVVALSQQAKDLAFGRLVKRLVNTLINVWPLKFWRNKYRPRILLFLCATIVFLVLVIAQQPTLTDFEGDLFVRSMSFTYSGESSNILLLNDIRSLREVQVIGEQSFKLDGSFQCENPSNAALKSLTSPMTIHLNNESNIVFSSISQGIELSELRLESQTKIAELSYNPSPETRYLLLKLESSEKKINSLLELRLGSSPLLIRIEGSYNISSPSWQKRIENSEPLECMWEPMESKYKFPLEEKTELVFSLPDISQGNINTENWFWQDLDVEEVKFLRVKRTNRGDAVLISTIEEGKLRMAGKEITLLPQQFLKINGRIKRLRNIDVDSEKGLQVRFAGVASKIQAGLDEQFLIEKIETTRLARLSPEIRSSIVSFLTSLITTLITLSFTIPVNGTSNN